MSVYTALWILCTAIAIPALAMFIAIRRLKSNEKQTDDKELDEKRPWKHDIFINVFWWQWVRVIVSLEGGIIVGLSVWLVVEIASLLGLFSYNFVSFFIFMMVAAIVFFITVQSDENEENVTVVEIVPEAAYAALITWFGMVVSIGGRNFYRTSGRYTWTGKYLGFGRLTKEVKEDDPFMNKNGFIRMEKIPFVVWKDAGARKDPNRTTVSASAKNNAPLSGKIILMITLEKPIRTVNNQDAALEIAEAVRQEWRELVLLLVDADVQRLMHNIEDVMRGKVVITCFLPKSVGAVRAGSMIRTRSGTSLYRVVEPDEDPKIAEENRKKAEEEFRKDVEERADPRMLKEVKDPKGPIPINEIKVSSSISKVVQNIGGKLDEVIISNIQLSEAVVKAAEQASAEIEERLAELEHADTQVEVQKRLQEGHKENNPDDLSRLAAIQQGGGEVRFVHVTGANANALAALGVAAAGNIKGDEK